MKRGEEAELTGERGRVRGVLGDEGDLARGIAIEREGDGDRVSS